MVWGMRLPDNFGEFWPSGNFEGEVNSGDTVWYKRLRDYYKQQTPDEQKRLFDYKGDPAHAWHAYGTYPSYKFIREDGTSEGPDQPLSTPLEPHEPPQFFQTERAISKLGSLIMLSGRILAVDEDLKTIIERVEPGVHQFYPLEIRMPRGKVFPKKYYTLVIGQWFNSYSEKDSDPDAYKTAKQAFFKAAFGDAHLWKDRGFPALTCFSDELKEAIDEAGIRLPKHYKMREV